MTALDPLTLLSAVCLDARAVATTDIRMLCLRLLACVAIRTGPGDVVLDAVAAKVESGVFEQPLDATAELELHINSITTSLERAAEPDEVRTHSRETAVCA